MSSSTRSSAPAHRCVLGSRTQRVLANPVGNDVITAGVRTERLGSTSHCKPPSGRSLRFRLTLAHDSPGTSAEPQRLAHSRQSGSIQLEPRSPPAQRCWVRRRLPACQRSSLRPQPHVERCHPEPSRPAATDSRPERDPRPARRLRLPQHPAESARPSHARACPARHPIASRDTPFNRVFRHAIGCLAAYFGGLVRQRVLSSAPR